MTSAPREEAGDAPTTQRIDKWLWFARLAKTRTLAAELVTRRQGPAQPRARRKSRARSCASDDVLTVVVSRRVRLFKVLGLGVRRGPAATARALYEELTAAADPLKPLAQSSLQLPSWHENEVGPGRRMPGSGRPTKKERREIDRLGGKTR